MRYVKLLIKNHLKLSLFGWYLINKLRMNEVSRSHSRFTLLTLDANTIELIKIAPSCEYHAKWKYELHFSKLRNMHVSLFFLSVSPEYSSKTGLSFANVRYQVELRVIQEFLLSYYFSSILLHKFLKFVFYIKFMLTL